MRFNLKSALVAATLAIGALTATSIATTPAQAHGFGGFGHGGFGHGGFGHGGFGHGGFGHGFGHWGHGWGHRWGGPVFGFYGGDYSDDDCYIKRYYNDDGDLVVRKVCY